MWKENGLVHPSKNLLKPRVPQQTHHSAQSHPCLPAQKDKPPGIGFLWAHPKGEPSTLSEEKSSWDWQCRDSPATLMVYSPGSGVSSPCWSFEKVIWEPLPLTLEPDLCLGPKPRYKEGQRLEKGSMCVEKRCVLLIMAKLDRWGKSGKKLR